MEETAKLIGIVLALGYFALMLAYDLSKNKKKKGKQMNRFFMMALIILSSNTYANTSYQFPFPFSSIKQDPEFAWTNEIWGKLKEVKITENGTDLAVLIGYENQLIKMSVKSKLDKNVWKLNQTVYLDKNDGHLKIKEYAPHIN